jgi:hypothetical protein
MSLPFGAGIGRLADTMGTYCENNQHWLDVASLDLQERGLSGRRDDILFGDEVHGLFDSAPVVYDVYDMDKQLTVMALAIATGTRLEFPNGKYANGWIMALARGCTESFELCLSDFLTTIEMMALGDLRLL